MNKTLFNQILQTLLPHMNDKDARKALIESALYGASILNQLQWEGAARTFAVRLIRQLNDYGSLEDGTPATVALLKELREGVGVNLQQEIDSIIQQISTPAIEQTIELPSETIENELYVFISYARPNQAIAEKVEAYLQAAGVKVFRDSNDIPEGSNWDMTIETALKDCDRMVLLLSGASMPYRKEVHREWFFFDQKRKPIYPLYIEDCELHSRMFAYNYIDARSDLQGALERLLKELGRDYALPDSALGADKVGVFEDALVPVRTLPEALQELLDAVREPDGSVVLSLEQATAIKEHKPKDMTEYRLGRIAEWSLPRYQLDNRFVNLMMMLDKGEDAQQRWQQAEDLRFNDLRDVLAKVDDPVLVLLGAPGSGKSTLLRRLQLDHSMEELRHDTQEMSFFIELNGYRKDSNEHLASPRDWLAKRWADRYPDLPSLESYLQEGRVLLLLDALNEMPHKNAKEYGERVALWREFAQDAMQAGNKIVFSCRSLDYSASLSSKDLRVPQIQVQAMDAEQVQAFIKAYTPTHADLIWKELDGSVQFKLFQTPYFLKLLCEQVEATREIPKGRASLFSGFVRQLIYRELNAPLFQADTLLNEKDHQKLNLGKWRNAFDLPERGILIKSLSQLAFEMQEQGLETEGAQVRIDYDDACDFLDHERDDDILKAGVALTVLDEDITEYEIAFFHQLLQEFFAARRLAKDPNPELVQVEWHVDKVTPSLEDTIATLADGDPLPPLAQTGWEETTLTAAPMAKKPNDFIRDLIAHNLPLAARCAASPEINIDPDLKHEIQQALIARTQDMTADLRARIASGLALGDLGDPRFERKTGEQGDYLMPPLVTIPAGTYTIGDDNSQYDREKPQHRVELQAFQIGQFPVTNAEYALFVEAGGYEDEQYWDTDEALAWLRGEGSTDGQKAGVRDTRKQLLQLSEEQLRGMSNLTSEQKEGFITLRSWSDERFEEWLDETYPSGQIYRLPEYWNNTRFNNPNQPVVGISWYEARAYCKWLSMQTGIPFDLPSEVQWEASARGTRGWIYPYDKDFDVTQGNTFESHIRRTTPIGIYSGTPEKIFDLSGNVYDWTGSIYDAEQFPYPYDMRDGRENISSNSRRVLRGGSWLNSLINARAVSRNNSTPGFRGLDLGFRVSVPLL